MAEKLNNIESTSELLETETTLVKTFLACFEEHINKRTSHNFVNEFQRLRNKEVKNNVSGKYCNVLHSGTCAY